MGRQGRDGRSDGPDGTLDPSRIDHLSEQISSILDTGRQVALVSSGAVGAGMGQLGLSRRPDTLPQIQAAAAVGQAYLIRAYDEGLRRHGRHAAQLLLTHEDFDSRPRYLNMRNTLGALFSMNAVPSSMRTTRSASTRSSSATTTSSPRWSRSAPGPVLVILSVVDGLFRTDEAGQLTDERIPLVPQIDEVVLGMAGTVRSSLGTGGMQSKLAAARLVTHAGGSVIIASGKSNQPLTEFSRANRRGPCSSLTVRPTAPASAGLPDGSTPRDTSWLTPGPDRRWRPVPKACWQSASAT